MSRVCVAGVGSARDAATYSGTPYFMLEAARAHQADPWHDLDLDVRSLRWRLRRLWWNVRGFALGKGYGGYQFTDAFLEHLWGSDRAQLMGATVLNWTQLFPSSIVDDRSIERSYYIDQTLAQLFDGYGVRGIIRADVADDALRREARGYAEAKAVIATSEWGRRGILEIGGVLPERTHAVPPGANVPLDRYEAWAARAARPPTGRTGPLRLVFVGSHPVRKGLDRLIRAVSLARTSGADLQLSVVGAQAEQLPSDLRRIPGITWHGRIDKVGEIDRFLEIVASADVGCLLSRSEASAIGLREYQALGLAVLGPDVGGCPDLVLPGAGRLVAPDATDEEVAEILVDLAEDRGAVESMRAESWRRRREVLWPAAVARIRDILR